MHADVPGLLADLMDIFDDTDVMGPVSGVSFNPEQRMHQPESDPESLRYADYADSFAMLIRRGCPARFDERFELGYFEDVDFCQQLRNAGRKIAIARGIGVDHRGRSNSRSAGTGTQRQAVLEKMHRNSMKSGIRYPRCPSLTTVHRPFFSSLPFRRRLTRTSRSRSYFSAPSDC